MYKKMGQRYNKRNMHHQQFYEKVNEGCEDSRNATNYHPSMTKHTRAPISTITTH